MANFVKAMLSVGRYESPDGIVNITPERLQRWKANYDKMHNVGYRVPMNWDHADDLDGCVPVRMGADLSRRRSSKDTAGIVKDLRLSADGRSAIFEIEAEGRAADQARTNRVFLSPVIAPAWKDGLGNRYQDVITHLDFVDHPVDPLQKPFQEIKQRPIACGVRMGIGGQVYRLGVATMAEDMSLDDMAGGGMDEGMEGAGMENEVQADPRVSSVVSALGEMGIMVEATDAESLLAALEQTLVGGGSPDDPGSSAVMADPGYAAMSLRLKSVEQKLVQQESESVHNALDALVKTGRATKAERDAKLQELSTVRMSLDQSGEVRKTRVHEWIDSRKAIPANTFANMTAGRAVRMGTGTVQPPIPGKVDEAMANQLADEILRS